MPNIFDSKKEGLHRLVTRLMGYVATWAGETVKVNYKGPASARDLNGFDYYPTVPEMEFFAGDFEDLKAKVDAGEEQSVVIEEIGIFWVRQVNAKFDGDTYTATLEIIELYQ